MIFGLIGYNRLIRFSSKLDQFISPKNYPPNKYWIYLSNFGRIIGSICLWHIRFFPLVLYDLSIILIHLLPTIKTLISHTISFNKYYIYHTIFIFFDGNIYHTILSHIYMYLVRWYFTISNQIYHWDKGI